MIIGISFKNIIAYILVLAFIFSCDHKKEQTCRDYAIQDYLVEIEFSSFWDCGVFKRIVLNNKGNGFSQKYTYCKEYTLYIINTKDRCKQLPLSDTLVVPLTVTKSDSLFDLANKFIKGYTLENHIPICDSNATRPFVVDGANINVNLCLENKCIDAVYYHYGHLENISTDLNVLLSYIDLLVGKK